MRLRLGNKHHLRKSADRKAQIRKWFVPLTELICAFRSADFLRWCLFPKRNLTHNLFFYFKLFLVLINLYVTEFTRNAMNSQFHSQLRLSCDCKLTRIRRANSHFHRLETYSSFPAKKCLAGEAEHQWFFVCSHFHTQPATVNLQGLRLYE